MATVPARVATFEDPASTSISRLHALWVTMRRKPLGAASAVLLAVIVLTAIFADVLAPYDPLETHPEIRLSAPSRAHPFGTDDIGRDVLSRIIYGSRISLWVGLLAGTVIVETIFALPGMGRLTVEAILFRDYPVVQTNVMLVAATLVALNLLVDLTYAWLDPRIKYQ